MERNELLKLKRTLLGLTQEDVAKKLFYTKQTISSLEKGRHLTNRNFFVYNKLLDELIEEHPKKDKFLLVIEILRD